MCKSLFELGRDVVRISEIGKHGYEKPAKTTTVEVTLGHIIIIHRDGVCHYYIIHEI